MKAWAGMKNRPQGTSYDHPGDHALARGAPPNLPAWRSPGLPGRWSQRLRRAEQALAADRRPTGRRRSAAGSGRCAVPGGAAVIRCKPKALCSWDYYLDGEGHHARVEFNWLTEQGAITADDVPFEVRKHGLFSGRWTLDGDRGAVVSAEKCSAF